MPSPTSKRSTTTRKQRKKAGVRVRKFRLDRGLSRRHRLLQSSNADRAVPVPLRREAEKVKAELANSALKLAKPFYEYGSTDGDWRLVSTKGRVVLPPRCPPRRSRRLNG